MYQFFILNYYVWDKPLNLNAFSVFIHFYAYDAYFLYLYILVVIYILYISLSIIFWNLENKLVSVSEIQIIHILVYFTTLWGVKI